MLKRTESDIVAKAPIEVTFGAKQYQITLLTILKQRDWRKQLMEKMRGIVEGAAQPATDNAVVASLAGALLDFPEHIADLVFAYDPELPKDTILEEATEEQLAAAFSAIMVVAFPFLTELGTVTKVMQSAILRQ